MFDIRIESLNDGVDLFIRKPVAIRPRLHDERRDSLSLDANGRRGALDERLRVDDGDPCAAKRQYQRGRPTGCTNQRERGHRGRWAGLEARSLACFSSFTGRFRRVALGAIGPR